MSGLVPIEPVFGTFFLSVARILWENPNWANRSGGSSISLGSPTEDLHVQVERRNGTWHSLVSGPGLEQPDNCFQWFFREPGPHRSKRQRWGSWVISIWRRACWGHPELDYYI